MGGKAFHQDLPPESLPRLSPLAYNTLKSHLLPRIDALYALVGVPAEAPEKADYGDLDFVVANPHGDVTHEQIKEALGAVLVKESEVTSNYAVPLDDGSKYCQVDVHVCSDAEDWERVMFFHSYGDLGMIIGAIVRRSGMSAGTKGLRVPYFFQHLPTPMLTMRTRLLECPHPYLLSTSRHLQTRFVHFWVSRWMLGDQDLVIDVPFSDGFLVHSFLILPIFNESRKTTQKNDSAMTEPCIRNSWNGLVISL